MADKPLDELKEANAKLDEALTKTVLAWPLISPCWIDLISEPTVDLQKHKLKEGPK